jgi:hypothetical protein
MTVSVQNKKRFTLYIKKKQDSKAIISRQFYKLDKTFLKQKDDKKYNKIWVNDRQKFRPDYKAIPRTAFDNASDQKLC